jgi:hypothetical protein
MRGPPCPSLPRLNLYPCLIADGTGHVGGSGWFASAKQGIGQNTALALPTATLAHVHRPPGSTAHSNGSPGRLHGQPGRHTWKAWQPASRPGSYRDRWHGLLAWVALYRTWSQPRVPIVAAQSQPAGRLLTSVEAQSLRRCLPS